MTATDSGAGIKQTEGQESGGRSDLVEMYLVRLLDIWECSPLLNEVFAKARCLEPFPYYVGAGCLVQTVWNTLTGRAADYGVKDIDLVYYDADDLSEAGEARMDARVKKIFADIPVPVDLKNQARIHQWYHGKFGIPLEPYPSLEAAIDSWPTTATSLGARLERTGEWCIYAPFGLEDLFTLTLRPNKTLINEAIYLGKTAKWRQKWPELLEIPW